MALIVSLTLPATTALINGEVVEVPETTYPAAYARVMFARAHSDKSYICVCWYATEADRFSGVDHVKAFEFITETATLTGDFYPATYSYLKTLPEFASAVDHLGSVPESPAPAPTPEPTETPAWGNTQTQPEAQA